MNTLINITQLSSLLPAMEALRVSTAVIGVFIYFGGFIGNFFSLILFIQKELRQVSTGLLFLLLNIISTIHLLSLIVEFIDSIFNIQVIPSGAFRCQFILWLQNASRTICSFLATTVSIDRFIRSEYPLRSRLWCTPKNAVKLSIIFTLFSTILYAFFFYPLNVFDDDGNCSFKYNGTFRIFALNVMPPIRFLLVCIIPSGVMLGCSGRMLYNIRKSHRRVAQQTTIVATIPVPISKASGTNNKNQRKALAVDNMLLVMVTANIVAYIITQIPLDIYSVYYGYETDDDFISYSLTRAFLLMWSSVYFGVGFYLCCIASPQFRKQSLTKIQSVFICCRPSQGQTTSTSTRN